MSSSDVSTFSLPSESLAVVSFIDVARTSISFSSSLTYLTMSSADSDVLIESLLTCSATTANPLPASPALAASIDALRARRLLWLATFLTISTISPILSIFSLKSCTCLLIILIFSNDSLTTLILSFILAVLFCTAASISCVLSRIPSIETDIPLIESARPWLALSISAIDVVCD